MTFDVTATEDTDITCQLRFLAAAQGNLQQMQALLSQSPLAILKPHLINIADTARQLALRAEEVGLSQISAAADVVELTAGNAKVQAPGEYQGFKLRMKEQLNALAEQIKEDLIECAPRLA